MRGQRDRDGADAGRAAETPVGQPAPPARRRPSGHPGALFPRSVPLITAPWTPGRGADAPGRVPGAHFLLPPQLLPALGNLPAVPGLGLAGKGSSVPVAPWGLPKCPLGRLRPAPEDAVTVLQRPLLHRLRELPHHTGGDMDDTVEDAEGDICGSQDACDGEGPHSAYTLPLGLPTFLVAVICLDPLFSFPLPPTQPPR